MIRKHYVHNTMLLLFMLRSKNTLVIVDLCTKNASILFNVYSYEEINLETFEFLNL